MDHAKTQLSNSDVVALTAFRHELHRFPEVSGQERETARRVRAVLTGLAPDRIISDIGGHGVAAVFDGAAPGPVVLIRCELDALPITETTGLDYASTHPGTGHLCGHDGHMAILTGVGHVLARVRPARGRVILMYQPAEEDGSGAAAVIADPKYPEIAPDYAFSLHNMPGVSLGHVDLVAGPVNCASRGMKISLLGKTSHASQPEKGTSPAGALAALIPALTDLADPAPHDPRDFTLTTITHARLGEAAFGIAPGAAELWVTLRTLVDDRMADLVARAEALVRDHAGQSGLVHDISYHDVFAHCENDPEATKILQRAMDAIGVPHGPGDLPMRGSEDFGRFGKAGAKSAMFFLGAGTTRASLHNPDYDFPDALIPIGARIFLRVVRDLLG